ncbi:cyclin-P4-1-like [Oryza glaberrima]|uniref:Cyclin n=2 Tax=Oryza TaxID=4527 RepID=A0A0D3F8A7_9ORYZ|nr:cyclin-P4-1-like [Oryza glaberrima]
MAEGAELVGESAHQDMPRVVAALAGILERVAGRNDAAATPAELAAAPASPFRATAKPGISVRAYAARIARFAGCSPACYVVAYIYLDRLLRRGRRCLALALAVDSYSVHRLLITAVLSAVKFMDDICYNNAYFAKVGGISLAEMNYLEVDFLFGVGFDLNVTPETFADYCAVLQSEMLCAAALPPRLHYCCLSEDDAGSSSSSSLREAAMEAS